MVAKDVTRLEWVIFILSFLIVITYIWCQLFYPNLEKYVKNNQDSIKWIDLDDILSDAQNGDLLLLSGNTRGEKTCKWCTGSMFSHVGLLFREVHPETKEDILYIWDCDLGQGAKEGPRVMPLKQKLDKYKGCKMGGYRPIISHHHNDLSTPSILEIISQYVDKGFDDKILTWWVADSKALYTLIKNEDTLFCSELIASTLQSLNVMKKDKRPAWYNPGDFYKGTLPLQPGYVYGESKFFRFK